MRGGFEALLRGMGTGLLVTELMGQGVNTVTGDYSRGAAGFWVEDGEITFPVDGITIAGNLKKMFAGDRSGGDRCRSALAHPHRFDPGRRMTVAGE